MTTVVHVWSFEVFLSEPFWLTRLLEDIAFCALVLLPLLGIVATEHYCHLDRHALWLRRAHGFDRGALVTLTLKVCVLGLKIRCQNIHGSVVVGVLYFVKDVPG